MQKSDAQPRGNVSKPKLRPVDVYVLWRLCRSIDSEEGAAGAAMAELFPEANAAETRAIISLGLRLGLLDDPSRQRLTVRGKRLAAAENVRYWRPENLEQVDASACQGFFLRTKNRPAVLDLFAGAGGLGLGFEKAGFEVVAAVENDPQACEAHRRNFPNSKVLEEDIVTFSKSVRKRLEAAEVDITAIDGVIGGPPCQGFSFMGERATNDERNLLTSRFVDIVEAIEPKFFVME